MNILVLCTGNSARSILLETILNKNGAPDVRAWSAGSHPAGAVHPQSVKLLSSLGYNTNCARSKSWDEFAHESALKMDAVITVCSSAENETCPMWPGAPMQACWGVEDPAKADPSGWETAFNDAYRLLKAKADALLGASPHRMSKAALQQHLIQSGRAE